MTCHACDDLGIWPYVDVQNPKADDAVTTDDLLFAICLCAVGQAWRKRENEGRTVAPLWHVWCARHQVAPSRVCLIEDVLTHDQLVANGLTKPTQPAQSREAALLTASSRKR